MIDNPCLTLSNVGSYTNWTADFSNSRCSRTVDNSYPKVIQSTTGCWGDNKGFYIDSVWQCSSNKCVYTSSMYGYKELNIGEFFITKVCKPYSYAYYCPNGGTLGSTTCTKIDTEYKAFSSF